MHGVPLGTIKGEDTFVILRYEWYWLLGNMGILWSITVSWFKLAMTATEGSKGGRGGGRGGSKGGRGGSKGGRKGGRRIGGLSIILFLYRSPLTMTLPQYRCKRLEDG